MESRYILNLSSLQLLLRNDISKAVPFPLPTNGFKTSASMAVCVIGGFNPPPIAVTVAYCIPCCLELPNAFVISTIRSENYRN